MPKGLSSRTTPMIQQFYTLKSEAPDALLFFRMGDFYELFGDDASCAAPLLGIVLTAREKGDQQKIPFCGIPHHSYSHHLVKLLRLGHKVAIADQMAEESAAGLMKRKIVRIHTLSCTDEMKAFEEGETHPLLAVYECPNTRHWHFLLCDYSLGDLRFGVVESFEEVSGIFDLHKPKELMVRKFQKSLFADLAEKLKAYDGLLSDLPEEVSGLAGEVSDPLGATVESLSSDFEELISEVKFIRGLPQRREAVQTAKVLLASVLSYFDSLKASTSHFRRVRSLHEPESMALSEMAIRDLELLRCHRTGKARGSLWQIIHHCSTPMGSRYLKQRILHPYLDPDKIRLSHRIIERLLELPPKRLSVFADGLSGACDIERLAHHLARKKLAPAQAAMLLETLKIAGRIEDSLISTFLSSEADPVSAFFASLQESLTKCHGARELLRVGLKEDLRELGSGTGVIKEGYDHELDELRSWLESGDQELQQYEQSLRADLGYVNLKIKPHKTYGYLIEMTKANVAKLDWDLLSEPLTLKQTMVGSQRYTSPTLEAFAEKMASSRERAEIKERELYGSLMTELAEHKLALLEVATAIAKWDGTLSMALTAIKHDFSKPELTSGDVFELEGSFHPVVAANMPSHKYTTNQLSMSQQHKCFLITGPNMGGKSTLMRQVALTAILSQMGGFVPASRAKLPVFDGIYTRIGASDNLVAGQSTFMVEMHETAYILQKATPSSLIILDELGRGTSTDDGMALAWSLLKEFATQLQSWVLFATHYHDLANKASDLPRVQLMQTEVLRREGKLHFSYRLIPGVCSHSFGLETARLAGISEPILKEAEQNLAGTSQAPAAASSPEPSPRSPTLFSHSSHAADSSPDPKAWLMAALDDLEPSSLTPLEALHILLEWKEHHQSPSPPPEAPPPPPAHPPSSGPFAASVL